MPPLRGINGWGERQILKRLTYPMPKNRAHVVILQLPVKFRVVAVGLNFPQPIKIGGRVIPDRYVEHYHQALRSATRTVEPYPLMNTLGRVEGSYPVRLKFT